MTNALTSLVDATPEHLARFGVEPLRTIASIDAAKFDNRPTWSNKEGSTADPAGTTGTRRSDLLTQE